ncbi:MAG TPA: hypothetical protein VL119_11425 [Acidimicrobiia bacterium]|nr:hypothetical protein [Acidimicrobiia bacterium]
MDVEVFGQALAKLSLDDIRSVAVDLHAVCTSTADEIAATRAMLMIEQTLRHVHRLHDAAAAALAAATRVQDAAQRSGAALPDADVTFVARAAAQLARGMVVAEAPGVDEALHVLGRGWQRLPCLAEFQAA